MTIFLIILFVLNIVLNKILNKKGFITTNIKYYILYTFIFVYILILEFPKIFKIKILFLFISNIILYKSIVLTFLLITMFIFGNYDIYKSIGKIIFKRTLSISSKTPTIIISNYPSDYLEYLIPGLFTNDTCIVAFKGAKKILENVFKEKIIYIDLDSKNNFEIFQKEIKDKIDKGYNIYVYPEKTYYQRKDVYDLQNFKSGIFHIAKKLNLTITPIICDHSENNFGFSNYSEEKYKIKILESFKIKNVKEDIEKCFKIMKRKLKHLRYKN